MSVPPILDFPVSAVSGPINSGRKRPLPDFQEESHSDSEKVPEITDSFEVPLISRVAPCLPGRSRDDDWVPGLFKSRMDDADISRNRESLNNLFSDEIKPKTLKKVSKTPTKSQNPKSKIPSAPPTQRSTRRSQPLSTDERILQEAAIARKALHERIARSVRVAAKFRAENASGSLFTHRSFRN